MTELTERVLATMNELLKEDAEPERSDLDRVASRLGAKLHWGATRWAFVFTKHKVVYKFPRWSEIETDYCELELENYELGKKYRIERCLLPIEKVGETDAGIPIYLQPMYTSSQDGLSYDRMKQWEHKMQKTTNRTMIRKIQHGCFSSPQRFWMERATQIYGKAFMRSFEKWSHEGRVNDLHSGNVGWLGRQPIIIDYAGYHGD